MSDLQQSIAHAESLKPLYSIGFKGALSENLESILPPVMGVKFSGSRQYVFEITEILPSGDGEGKEEERARESSKSALCVVYVHFAPINRDIYSFLPLAQGDENKWFANWTAENTQKVLDVAREMVRLEREGKRAS